LLRRRELLKGQIETSSGRYKSLDDIKLWLKEVNGHYSTLNTIGSELVKLLERRRRKGLEPFVFRGIDAMDLVRLDFWEDEYIRKVEVRVELVQKFNQKKVVKRIDSWVKK
jgi:hypothetical protein